MLLIGVIYSQHAPPRYEPIVDPASDHQTDFPVRVSAYYPWYPESWAQEGQDRFSHYQPNGGYYRSDDVARIGEQIAAMRYGYVDVALDIVVGPGPLHRPAHAGICWRRRRQRAALGRVLRD